ncbi:MAG: hypothetical protein JHC87_05270 [Thermoleophilaceae bacterium]|nr:hypothetical protein [Thermoleophilaceae bacterium]
MRAVRAKISIDRPADEIYEYLLDIASRPEFAGDLFLDFRLTRVESYGKGAGARFRLDKRMRDRFAGLTVTQATPFSAIVEEGSTGRGGRVPLRMEYDLAESTSGLTTVTFTIATSPSKFEDRMREFGMHRALSARATRVTRRLRDILEGAPRAPKGDRPTVGGMDLHHVPNP